MGHIDKIKGLMEVHLKINEWYDEDCQKVKIQSKMYDDKKTEQVRMYHHALHQKTYQELFNS